MDNADDGITRRDAIIAGLAITTSDTALGARPARENKMSPTRLPVVYLPHGGGPWPWMDQPIGGAAELAALRSYLEELRAVPKSAVKAVLAISAHWEEPVPTVMTSARPPMLYDYYGFPPETYSITWPAPGEPKVAARVRALLDASGLASASDAARGFDHGTFVPLKLTYPQADVPTVQLSLQQGLDPKEHLAIGRALAPLRDEGVFIIGSGLSFHNLRGFGPQGRQAGAAFDAWLQQVGTAEQRERDAGLERWTSAPAARAAHPREEHLMPLMVVAGAAGADRGTVAFAGTLMGVKVSAYHFG